MRWIFVLIAIAVSLTSEHTAPRPAEPTARVDITFERDVLPIVQRCTPCHFPGGSMHGRLPFDRAETIDALGTKLFTRIQREEERAILRAYFDRPSK
ncbi:MAG TPA: hypothetical protein VIL97_10670 [Thermoanaerobaculia bacterium]